MVWHLNKLPGGMPGLKDINSDKFDSFLLNSGAGRKKGAHGILSNSHGTSVEVNYTAYTATVAKLQVNG